MPQFFTKNEESSWQKASASLDASAKIYGYRVDSVHSDTFKFLSGLNRTDMKENINNEEDVVNVGNKKDLKDKIPEKAFYCINTLGWKYDSRKG